MLTKEQSWLIFKISPVPHLILKPDATGFSVVEGNDAFVKILNVQAREIEGKNILDIYSKTKWHSKVDEKELISSLINAMENGATEVILVNGNLKINNHSIYNEQGEVEFILHTLIELPLEEATQENSLQTIEGLLQSKELNTSLFTHNPDAVFVFTLDGKFILGNNSLARIAETSLEELLKMDFFPFIAPEDRKKVNSCFQKAVSGEIQNYECHAITAKGNFRILNVTNIPVIVKDKIEGVYGIAKDITLQQKAEQALKESEEKYRMIFNFSPLPMWIYDKATLLILEVNEAAILHYGYSRDEFLQLSIIDIYPKEDVEALKKTVKILSNEKFKEQGQWKHLKKNGELIDVEIKSVDINYSGLPASMIIANDITQKKNAEVLLKKLNDQLKMRAEELAESNAELEQFAYIASHDLKEPLRMITSFLQILKKKYGENLDETARTYINYAVDGSFRMQQLIKDLLRYSRTGREETKKEMVDLNNLVKEVELNLMKQIEENKAEIQVQMPLPVLPVFRSEMIRLFQNLISNAIKFRKKEEHPVIKIAAEEGKTHWIISIEDNGIGIPKEHQQRIFDIFRRLHTRQEYPGTGIGLAICKKIIKQHNGEIWVISEKARGSTFYFSIIKTIA